MITCIYGIKLSDIVIIDEDNNVYDLIPNKSYPLNKDFWWMLDKVDDCWMILRCLGKRSDE